MADGLAAALGAGTGTGTGLAVTGVAAWDRGAGLIDKTLGLGRMFRWEFNPRAGCKGVGAG